jgi:dihydroneopterin aldolase
MVNEIKIAFEHPKERSKYFSKLNPLDRISLRDYVREVEIGAFHSERGTRQRIKFNIVVEVLIPDNPDDDVDLVFSYDSIISAINKELSFERINLLETLAERIATNVLGDKRAKKIFIRIEKLDRAPGALGIEIVRSSFDTKVIIDKPLPECRVIVFDEVVFFHDSVDDLITILTSENFSTIIIVPGSTSDQSTTPKSFARTRLNLLSMDQNAWVLTEKNEKCQVVETRTELEWIIRNKKVGIWSPSKLILSSTNELDIKSTSVDEMALWLTKQLNITEIFSFGEALKGIGIPLKLADVLKSKTFFMKPR